MKALPPEKGRYVSVRWRREGADWRLEVPLERAQTLRMAGLGLQALCLSLG